MFVIIASLKCAFNIDGNFYRFHRVIMIQTWPSLAPKYCSLSNLAPQQLPPLLDVRSCPRIIGENPNEMLVASANAWKPAS